LRLPTIAKHGPLRSSTRPSAWNAQGGIAICSHWRGYPASPSPTSRHPGRFNHASVAGDKARVGTIGEGARARHADELRDFIVWRVERSLGGAEVAQQRVLLLRRKRGNQREAKPRVGVGRDDAFEFEGHDGAVCVFHTNAARTRAEHRHHQKEKGACAPFPCARTRALRR
jgi:hypothetical protein